VTRSRDRRASFPSAAINNLNMGRSIDSPVEPAADESPCVPAWLDPQAVPWIACFGRSRLAERGQPSTDDLPAIGRPLLDYLAATFGAGAPPPATYTRTEVLFDLWWYALLHQGLSDSDALLLASLVHAVLPLEEAASWKAFQETVALALPVIDRKYDPAAAAALDTELRAALAQSAKGRRRGRPKGRDPKIDARDLAKSEKVFNRRRAEGKYPMPGANPWQVLEDVGGIADRIIESDRGISNTQHLLRDDGDRDTIRLRDFLGSSAHDIPPRRRYLVIRTLAERCLCWWLDQYEGEIE
jgi:hypothetical protein